MRESKHAVALAAPGWSMWAIPQGPRLRWMAAIPAWSAGRTSLSTRSPTDTISDASRLTAAASSTKNRGSGLAAPRRSELITRSARTPASVSAPSAGLGLVPRYHHQQTSGAESVDRRDRIGVEIRGSERRLSVPNQGTPVGIWGQAGEHLLVGSARFEKPTEGGKEGQPRHPKPVGEAAPIFGLVYQGLTDVEHHALDGTVQGRQTGSISSRQCLGGLKSPWLETVIVTSVPQTEHR